MRLLKETEIECRVGMVNEKGASLLLYKDARVDQKILDELYGPFGWKRSHQEIAGEVFCTVEVWDAEKKEWISKQDVGTSGGMEQAKSAASDSFKRASFNWGIGRELYSAPFIWIPIETMDVIRRNDGTYSVKDRFSVKKIEYGKDNEITALSIQNGKGHEVYRYQKNEGRDSLRNESVVFDDKLTMQLFEQLDRTGVDLETVLKRYNASSLEELTSDNLAKAINGLRRTKTKAA